jgi:hypothetical protein
MRTPLIALIVLFAASVAHADSRPSTVAEILEDDGANLIAKLQDESGGRREAHIADYFSGKSCVKVMPLQLQQRKIPGWSYRIVQRPKVGEYRYIRFAWKAPGAVGIMVQLHDEKDWNIRFTAGADQPNWGSKFVAQQPPVKWTVVTRDLFAEFGERTISGIALSIFGDQPGYFDHIYFGRSIEELDGIDASGVGGTITELKPDDLSRLWAALADEDAAKSYRAYWTLAAAPRESVPFLRQTLMHPPQLNESIRKWILELEADEFLVREKAYRNLEQHLEAAIDQLKKEHPAAPPESQARIEQLLKMATTSSPQSHRISHALRLLKYLNTAESKALLEDFSREKAKP